MIKKKAAIYHFTNESEKRPLVYKKMLRILEDFAESCGFQVTEIFCDMSLRVSEHPEFDRFMSRAEEFDALIVKDFYHIRKNTMQCMSIMKTLSDKCVKIISMDNGSFTLTEPPVSERRFVATYSSRFATKSKIKDIESIQNQIFNMFVEKKTQWIIKNHYFDERLYRTGGGQKELDDLIANKDQYDLILVRNLDDIYWHTARFCKIRGMLKKDIYSLQDGFLPYRG